MRCESYVNCSECEINGEKRKNVFWNIGAKGDCDDDPMLLLPRIYAMAEEWRREKAVLEGR
jgi:hypothetical protein